MADKDPAPVPDSTPEQSPAAPEGEEKAATLTVQMPQDIDNENDETKGQSSSQSEETQSLLTPKTPGEKVRFILSDENDALPEDASFLESRTLFCQLDVLCHFADGVQGWKEKSRWLKYEEKVEGGDRWSKPHVGTSSLHSLYEVRRGFETRSTIVSLDMPSTHGCMHQVAELLSQALEKDGKFPADKARQVLDVLLTPHKHLHRSGMKGKPQSSASFNAAGDKSVDINDNNSKKKKKLQKKDDLNESGANVYNYQHGVTPDNLKPHKSNKKMMRKIPPGAEAANILVGQVDFLDQPLTMFVRLAQPAVLNDLTEVDVPTRFLYIILAPEHQSSLWEHEEAGRAMANMLTDKVFREVAYRAQSSGDLLDGIDEFIDDLTVLPPSVWDPATRLDPPIETITTAKVRRRLDTSRYEADDVDMKDHGGDPTLVRTGRICGGLIDDVKRRYGQYASDIKDGFSVQSIASIVFLFFACITPIVTFGGLMGKSTDGYMGTVESLLSGAVCGITFALFSGQPLTIVGATGPLLVFESILYQFCNERGMDFMSFRFWIGTWVAVTLVIIVVFDLSAMVRYITRFTEESFSILISLIFIVEAILKVIHIWDEAPVETNIGDNPDRHACHCQHPEEWLWGNNTDPNATLPYIPYPSGGSGNLSDYNIQDHPMFRTYNWSKLLEEDCISVGRRVEVAAGCISAETCLDYGWTLIGETCPDPDGHSGNPIPDVFLLSVLLFLGTFIIAMMLRYFRNTPYFPNIVRGTVADFAVLIAILICTGVDYSFGIPTPKLLVPSEFKTTRDGRGWVVNPMALLPMWYLIPMAILPSLLATILIFLDQQITAVIINRKEHKLKKGPGYHLDLLVLAVLIFVTSLLGLPWFVAATVRSITHVRSLFVESETRAPGEKAQMLGVREQRVTALVIHILIGASVTVTSVLQNIPMPVLYGVFMYMGVTSLNGVQFIQRIGLLLMPSKYQPDYIYLRHVSTKRVHIFTAIQIICMVMMWAVKSYKAISITFPLLVLALCFVRKFMDYFMTQSELFWLDHILPDDSRRKAEDEGHEESSIGDIKGEPHKHNRFRLKPHHILKRHPADKDAKEKNETV